MRMAFSCLSFRSIDVVVSLIVTVKGAWLSSVLLVHLSLLYVMPHEMLIAVRESLPCGLVVNYRSLLQVLLCANSVAVLYRSCF